MSAQVFSKMNAIGHYELIDSSFDAYDESAPLVFQRLRQMVLSQLPQVEIEHTGSTAIGIAGKNVIDALLVCQRREFTEVLAGLEEAGFQVSPFQSLPEDRPLRVGSMVFQNKRWLIHLHLTARGSADHQNILFFRDYLRANREAAEEYARIKQQAVAAGKTEATAYNDEKAPFILSVLERRRA
jgi:GrpB-like predicted nucleotidyltransferase (UPF0157 family)